MRKTTKVILWFKPYFPKFTTFIQTNPILCDGTSVSEPCLPSFLRQLCLFVVLGEHIQRPAWRVVQSDLAIHHTKSPCPELIAYWTELLQQGPVKPHRSKQGHGESSARQVPGVPRSCSHRTKEDTTAAEGAQGQRESWRWDITERCSQTV